MRIVSLEITNFKILRHLKLDNIPDLVVIAGPNGSGKTALFDAIRLLKESIASYSVRSPGSAMWHGLLQQIGPVVSVGASQATISASIQVSEMERQVLDMPNDHPGILQASIVVQHPPSLGLGQVENVSFPVTPAAPVITDYEYLRRLFGAYYRRDGNLGVIDHIGPNRQLGVGAVTAINFSIDVLEQELQSLVLNTASKFASLPQDLVMMRFIDMEEKEHEVPNPHHYINGIREIFRHFLPGTELLDITLASDLMGPIDIKVRSGEIEHDLNQLSSGQREILMTYTHLEKLRPTGSIILFDEPELHLHPTLQRRVIAYLQGVLERGNNQIWIITHSEEIVGTTEYDSLFAMTGQGSPAIVPVTNKAARVDLLRALGASVGLQLLSPRILFVEGESDAELLPLFSESLPENLSIVDTGGKGTLMRLTPAAMRILDEAVAEGDFFFVRDHDVEESPGVLDELERKHQGRFFVWDRYHIENYLLDEEAIFHVLMDDPDIPSSQAVNDIAQELRRMANARRDEVLAKHLEARLDRTLRVRFRIKVPEGIEASLRKAAAGRLKQAADVLAPNAIDTLYEEVRAELDASWEDDWKSLCIGRDVLQAFHKAYVTRYLGYDVFRNRIARKMREMGRVPHKVQEVVNCAAVGLSKEGL